MEKVNELDFVNEYRLFLSVEHLFVKKTLLAEMFNVP